MNSLQLFDHPLVSRLGWTLLHFLWQGLLIAALFAAVRGLAGRSIGSRARYALACLTFAAMVAALILTFSFLGSPEGGLPSARIAAVAPVTLGGSLPSPVPWYLPWLRALQPALPWLVMAWFTGVVIFLVRLAAGSIAAARLRSSANRAAPSRLQEALRRIALQLGGSRPVRLLISSRVDVPGVVGWLRPVILMPAGALTGWAPEHLEAFLAHELAHILRHDYLVNVIQNIAEAVLFYHPAVWWVSNQIRKERELCCDDLAVAASGDRFTYARALADLEARRPAPGRAAIAANGGSLLTRIRRLLDPSHPIPDTALGPAAVFVLILVLLSAGAAAVLANAQTQGEASGVLDRNTVWMDTVKQSDFSREVRGLGVLATNTTADLRLPLLLVKDVQTGQAVSVRFAGRPEVAAGKVSGIRPGLRDATVAIKLTSELPSGVQKGAGVDGTIEIERLSNVVQIGRPVESRPNSDGYLFKLEPDGIDAVRVKVKYGKASVNTIQILSGLNPGDKVILSDTKALNGYNRITLK